MKQELIQYLQIQRDLKLCDATRQEETAQDWETYEDEWRRSRAKSARMSRDWSLRDAEKFKEWIEWLNDLP